MAAIVSAALVTGAATTMDVRLGPNRALSAEREKSALLEDENQALRDQLSRQRQGRGSEASDAATASSPNCARYPTRETAQVAFVSDPVALQALDGDGDGNACEQLRTTAVDGSSGELLTSAGRSGATGPAVSFDQEPAAPDQEEDPPAGPAMPDAPSKSEIVDSGHHFGMATATTEEFDFLEFSLARDATMRGYYKGWDTPFDSNRVLSSWQRGEVPVMTWESRALAFAEDTTDYSLGRIADGDFDDYLTQYARDITELGLPLVIRFDQEMTGNWYRWAEFDAPYGNEKGDFIAAWRHIHDLFESVGANEHVVWLWSPNRIDNLTRFPSIDNYFPGTEYVDWVGMTGYHRPGDKSPTFAATYDKTLAELRRVAPGLPIMLSEIGATETGGQKSSFMESLFPGLEANPDIVGFIWFNYAITEKGVTNDWRLDSSPAVFDAFSAGLADSTFGRERGKRFVLVPRTTSEPPTTTTTSSTTSTVTTTTTTTTTVPPTSTTTRPAPTTTTSTNPPEAEDR
ncbi:MAG TPA: glycosyl hydrolase [Acidimicrobiales bacterium]